VDKTVAKRRLLDALDALDAGTLDVPDRVKALLDACRDKWAKEFGESRPKDTIVATAKERVVIKIESDDD